MVFGKYRVPYDQHIFGVIYFHNSVCLIWTLFCSHWRHRVCLKRQKMYSTEWKTYAPRCLIILSVALLCGHLQHYIEAMTYSSYICRSSQKIILTPVLLLDVWRNYKITVFIKWLVSHRINGVNLVNPIFSTLAYIRPGKKINNFLFNNFSHIVFLN